MTPTQLNIKQYSTDVFDAGEIIEISADVDIKGIIKLLDLSQFTNVEKFIYASSGCSVYGSYGKMPLKEDFISMHLTTPYQINKMAGEMYCNYYHHHYGLNIVNCRFFNSSLRSRPLLRLPFLW